MNDLSLALIRKGKGTGVVAGTTSHDLELALARKYGSGDTPAPALSAYLTFESSSAFSLTSCNGNTGKTWDGTLAYSTDAVHWFIWNGTKTLQSKESGGNHYLYLGGYDNTIITGEDSNVNFLIDGTGVDCTGDIRALLDHEKAAADEDPVMGAACFYTMFYGNTALTTAPSLPSKTLAVSCYHGMFEHCINLTAPPALPATTLEEYCYVGMFRDTGLLTAPTLAATSLATGCYSGMFANCTSLTTPPALPATTIARTCYTEMFYGCTSLTSAPTLAATSMFYRCYSEMFYGCTSLTTAPALPATTLEQGCYDGMFSGCSNLTATPALPSLAVAIKQNCYEGMFRNCTHLTSIPELPQPSLVFRCYLGMFSGCSALKLSTTQTTECPNAYRIPSSGTGTDSTGTGMQDMFKNTGGTFTGTPSINTTYYTNATIVPAA